VVLLPPILGHEIVVSNGALLEVSESIGIMPSSGGGQQCRVTVTDPGSFLNFTINGERWFGSANTRSNQFTVAKGGRIETKSYFGVYGTPIDW